MAFQFCPNIDLLIQKQPYITLHEIIELRRKEWEPFCGSYISRGLAKPRKQEIFACLNRFRG